mmetsp:Transcript_18756/g.57778  ORF Transcript_18756/g.57778 Transcript_18756/m.57778 type:complete len:118 (+) Transcript_18756:48-401(+)
MVPSENTPLTEEAQTKRGRSRATIALATALALCALVGAVATTGVSRKVPAALQECKFVGDDCDVSVGCGGTHADGGSCNSRLACVACCAALTKYQCDLCEATKCYDLKPRPPSEKRT